MKLQIFPHDFWTGGIPQPFLWADVTWHGCQPKNRVVYPPNHPFVHRVFHYFHHPFWGFPPIFGLTPTWASMSTCFTFKLHFFFVTTVAKHISRALRQTHAFFFVTTVVQWPSLRQMDCLKWRIISLHSNLEPDGSPSIYKWSFQLDDFKSLHDSSDCEKSMGGIFQVQT